MSEQFSMCTRCDTFGSLKDMLTLKQGVLLKLACWPLQSPGWLKTGYVWDDPKCENLLCDGPLVWDGWYVCGM